ncbi:MAG: GMC family oxidoreductase [Chlamydiales bacterium]|nr:GMC family oxidoreductase [Chlamydiales bacterium]
MINGWPYYPDDDVRRIQYLNNGGLPVNFGYGFVMQPQSRGSVEIVSKNPFDRPRIDLGLFTDGPVSTPGTDAYTLVSFLKIVKDIATEAGEVVFLPTPADYTDDDTLLAYAESNPNMIITSHITGTCRMAMSPSDGVVDGNLQVFGVKNLMIVNLGVAPVQPDCNPCVSIYAIANEAARILGVE